MRIRVNGAFFLFPFPAIRKMHATLLLCLLSTLLTHAQDRMNRLWSEGKLVLEDSAAMEGLIHYEIKTRLIGFKIHAQDTPSTFHEKRIASMSFQDARRGILRTFQSIHVREEDSGFKGRVLFEVLVEAKDFLIVSRRYPLKSGSIAPLKGAEEDQDHYENMYVIKGDGAIVLLATFTPGEHRVYPGKVAPFFNDALLIQTLGGHWKRVKAYAKDQKLRLKSRAGLLQVLHYYQELEK